MPYDDPDPQDPNILVGVRVPGDPSALREMATAFAEEFAALGFDEADLMALFRRPFYAGAHQALRLLGEGAILEIVRESLSVWGLRRIVVRDRPQDGGAEPPGLIRIATRTRRP